MKVNDKNSLCCLVTQTAGIDSSGFKTVSEESDEVWCSIESITQTEFFAAGQNKIKPEYKVTVSVDDYNGQRIVDLNGRRYGVYRTYQPGPDEIELYLEEKAGLYG